MQPSSILRPGVPAGLDISHLKPEVQQLLHGCRFVHLLHDLLAFILQHPFVQFEEIDANGNPTGTEGDLEAIVNDTLSGPVVNFPQLYMRTRDSKATFVTDAYPNSAQNKFPHDWEKQDAASINWLAGQKPIAVPLRLFGNTEVAAVGVAIMPESCAFFGYMLAILQEIINPAVCSEGHKVSFVIFMCPPFRKVICDGKQMVAHHVENLVNETIRRMSAFNLYPGPSGKKGAGYSMGMEMVAEKGGLILHASAIRLRTASGRHIGVIHEGASGAGKSEQILREHRKNGKIRLSRHVVTGEERWLELRDVVEDGMVHPVIDDMALAFVRAGGKLVVSDAEQGWFLRTDNSTAPGTDPFCEYLGSLRIAHKIWLSVEPQRLPVPWLRTKDSKGVRTKNGRLVIGRKHIPNIVNHPIEVDIRSIGVRAPNCTKPHPYGIFGFCQVMDWWLAYLWRLAPPRGDDNPSIGSDEGGEDGSEYVLPFEGVGAYEAFLLGDPIEHANLLLRQFAATAKTITHILMPNQNIGAYWVGFAPQNVNRVHLALDGKIEANDWSPCTLLGREVKPYVEDAEHLFRPHTQPELRDGLYDTGKRIVEHSFRTYLPRYLDKRLHPVAARLIQAVVNSEDLRKLEVSPQEVLET